MELLYITHHTVRSFPPVISWVLVIGAAYGAVSLLKDAVRVLTTPLRRRAQSKDPSGRH